MGSNPSLWTFAATSRNRARLHIPNIGRVLCDRAVARELPGASYIQDCLARPSIRVSIEVAELAVSLEIGREVRQVHVVVPTCQQRVLQRCEDTRFIPTEVIGKDEVERGACLRLVLVVP